MTPSPRHLDETGRPSFLARQHRASECHAIVYYVFDLLAQDLTHQLSTPSRAALAKAEDTQLDNAHGVWNPLNQTIHVIAGKRDEFNHRDEIIIEKQLQTRQIP